MNPDDLYEAGRHEPLTRTRWDESLARDAVRDIVRDVEAAFGGDALWPIHPLDDYAGLPAQKGLYMGAAGVMWSLHHLAARGAVTLERDYRPLVAGVHEAYRQQPDMGEVVPSYLFGEVGILLVARLLGGSPGRDDRLAELIEGNADHPAREACWGAPGTMLAAGAMYAETGDERWKALFLGSADALWRDWIESRAHGCRLWTQDMYGFQVKHIGAGHGLAGNVFPLLCRADWLGLARRDELVRDAVRAVVVTARRSGSLANWPQSVGEPRPGRTAMLVQWCHGAPGMVTALRHLPAGLDDLLVCAGELTWRAGPLAKGHGLCHGTAGNGHAFLELYRRSGQPMWLERARAFAMHALEQRARMMATFGRGRYSLWTGDLGLAIYLVQCATGDAGLPALDFI